jgi:hypothetical protein
MRRVVLASLIAIIGVAGCSGGSHHNSRPVPAKTPTPGPATSGPPVTDPAALPTCPHLVTDDDVAHALGRAPGGTDTYVRAAPLPQIGRTGRVTCGFGVQANPDGSKTPPVVEASLMTYTDVATAGRRVDAGVQADKAAGAKVSQVTVSGRPANVDVAANGAATLLVADGNRTVVITLAANAVPADKAQDVLTALAGTILTNAAHLTVPPTTAAAPTPSRT